MNMEAGVTSPPRTSVDVDACHFKPRLQHLLMRLWNHRERAESGDRITLEQYRQPEIGGLDSALDLHAEQTYAALSEEQQRIAKRMFQRLTT